MINNILRVILSRALFHETMKEREKLEKEIKEKKAICMKICPLMNRWKRYWSVGSTGRGFVCAQ